MESPAHIVLLDDEPRLLQTLSRFLQNAGHTVSSGGRFADVERHLHPGRFDLLITDIVMPDRTGIEVLEEVVHERGCREPVVIITGEPNVESAAAAVRLGAFDYLTKPVTKDNLLEVCERSLRHVRLLRERDQARSNELDLLRSLAALGESAAILSHEVRTPMTSLRQALRAVGERLGVEDRVLVEELVRGLQRIEGVLTGTLSFARPLRLQPGDVPLASVIDEAVAQARALPACRELQIETCVPVDLPLLHVDRPRMVEVCVNLIHNAADATGGRGRLVIQAGRRGAECTIEFADDGPGVPAGKDDEIFRPFHSTKADGTGIGLAFSRKIIEAHDGTLALVREDGPGARFRITLPFPPERRTHVVA